MNFDDIKKLNQLIDEKDKEILTLRKALEKESIESQKTTQETHDFYQRILALMPGHVYWMDRSNVILGCNKLQANNVGFASSKDIIGKTLYDLPWKDQADELNNLNNIVMDTGVPHTAEEYTVTAEGTTIYLSNKTPLRDKDNEIVGILGISIDITERKKLEVALRHAKEKAETATQKKSEFIANISQDMRIPISGIMDMSKQLYQRLTNTKEKQHALWIYKSSKHLLKLFDKLCNSQHLDMIEENETHVQPYNLRQSIQETSTLLYPKLKLNDVHLKIDIAEDVPELLLADAIKLQRILLTILVNSMKHTQSGTITIKVELVSRDTVYAQLRFSIIDTGSVIPHESLATLFNRPSIKDSTHDLSLYIAQKYVGLLGGEIQVDSELNKGSTFYYTLSMKID